MPSKCCRLYAQKDLRIEEDALAPLTENAVLLNMGVGGICGSDLHYYTQGGFGPVRVREPIILGHEVSGTVEKVGSNVSTLKVGDKVAINPSHPCLTCSFCKEGHHQHCKKMHFLGSARTTPHAQGGFRSKLLIDAKQCEKVSPSLSLAEAACAEPLAVCLHARNQVETLQGKRVLITGAGPIGTLCAAVCAQAGASEIVVTDLHDFTLSIALQMGATKILNVTKNDIPPQNLLEEGHLFDVAFECSSAEPALAMALKALRPQGSLIQIGVAGNLSIPLNELVGKEIRFIGTHRFHREFKDAVEYMNKGLICVRPLITQTFPMEQACEAFELAADRSKAMKVQLMLEGAV